MDCPVAIFGSGGSMRYFTETPSIGGILFVDRSESVMIASDAELAERTGFDVMRSEPGSGVDMLLELLKARRTRRLGVELGGMSCPLYSKLSAKGVKLVDVGPAVSKLRSVKEKEEIGRIREACLLSDRAMAAAASAIREGATEMEVRKAAMCAVLDKCEAQSFDFIVASGENSLYTHILPSTRKIARGDSIIIDLGVSVDGYNADITRTFCIKPGEKLEMLYSDVGEAQDLAMAAARGGARCGQAYEKVGKFFETKHLRTYWKYGLGHGVGLEVHESPSFSKGSKDVLRENMVFTIEPGIHITGIGGVRIEDTVLLTKRGPEKLSKYRYGLEP